MPTLYPKHYMKLRCTCYKSTCTCPRKDQTNQIFLENIEDVANALSEVLKICGIHPCKAKGAIDVIIFAFLHYDDIRHRIDTVPRKRLPKDDVIHMLSFKCLMTLTEAQLTYSIMKRAFKAFYHGTDEGGLRNTMLEAQLIHTQECMWVHAAKRSAQIFASYEGMFFMSQMNYEAQIRCVYKELYERMKKRCDPAEVEKCACADCNRQASENVRVTYDYGNKTAGPATVWPMDKVETLPDDCKGICTQTAEKLEQLSEVVAMRPPKHKPSNVSIDLPRCKKCKCPELVCDCAVDPKTNAFSGEFSQGPFRCIWFRRDEHGDLPFDMEMEMPPPDHECPVDCKDSDDVSCDSDYECDCEFCDCEDDDYAEDFGYEGEAEVEDEQMEELSYESKSIERPIIYGDCRRHDLGDEEEEENGDDSVLSIFKFL